MILLKIDFLEADLFGELLSELEAANLTIDRVFYVSFTLDDIKILYQWENLYNIEMMIDYWCNKLLPVITITGQNAVNKALEIKKRIRSRRKSSHEMYTLMHCPDSSVDYEREIAFLLRKGSCSLIENGQDMHQNLIS